MDNPDIDETSIREYLLGRIHPEEKLSTQIDERMLEEPEFSLLMNVIEDEILEDYLDGALSAADRKAVEIHFLTPPERQRKLRATRLINHRIGELAAGKDSAQSETPPRAGSTERRRLVVFPNVRTWAEVAAGLALVSCSIYLWNQQRELRHALMQSRQELASSKDAQRGPHTTVEAAAVTLNLMIPGLSRGDQELPQAHLPSGAATLHISIALSAQPEARPNVRLEQGNTVAWSRAGVETRAVAGGAVLSVDLPTAIVPQGTCRLVVSGLGRGEVSYWFKVSKSL